MYRACHCSGNRIWRKNGFEDIVDKLIAMNVSSGTECISEKVKGGKVDASACVVVSVSLYGIPGVLFAWGHGSHVIGVSLPSLRETFNGMHILTFLHAPVMAMMISGALAERTHLVPFLVYTAVLSRLDLSIHDYQDCQSSPFEKCNYRWGRKRLCIGGGLASCDEDQPRNNRAFTSLKPSATELQQHLPPSLSAGYQRLGDRRSVLKRSRIRCYEILRDELQEVVKTERLRRELTDIHKKRAQIQRCRRRECGTKHLVTKTCLNYNPDCAAPETMTAEEARKQNLQCKLAAVKQKTLEIQELARKRDELRKLENLQKQVSVGLHQSEIQAEIHQSICTVEKSECVVEELQLPEKTCPAPDQSSASDEIASICKTMKTLCGLSRPTSSSCIQTCLATEKKDRDSQTTSLEDCEQSPKPKVQFTFGDLGQGDFKKIRRQSAPKNLKQKEIQEQDVTVTEPPRKEPKKAPSVKRKSSQLLKKPASLPSMITGQPTKFTIEQPPPQDYEDPCPHRVKFRFENVLEVSKEGSTTKLRMQGIDSVDSPKDSSVCERVLRCKGHGEGTASMKEDNSGFTSMKLLTCDVGGQIPPEVRKRSFVDTEAWHAHVRCQSIKQAVREFSRSSPLTLMNNEEVEGDLPEENQQVLKLSFSSEPEEMEVSWRAKDRCVASQKAEKVISTSSSQELAIDTVHDNSPLPTRSGSWTEKMYKATESALKMLKTRACRNSEGYAGKKNKVRFRSVNEFDGEPHSRPLRRNSLPAGILRKRPSTEPSSGNRRRTHPRVTFSTDPPAGAPEASSEGSITTFSFVS
ncbi:unnamed protein product [Cyprideis torosa]|uniref:Uncharacterized protein n=1 Tax=Cyprideis torosa TaxID=163714 RepID=A0A7R8W9B1_9CRUS|nr:unnamed protein product [Cyprideis torosa]CAG0884206.1 unnamed protein product [Cyprideis torosa]